jgi:hypothetical protein
VEHITAGYGAQRYDGAGCRWYGLGDPWCFFCRFQFCNVLIEEETVER